MFNNDILIPSVTLFPVLMLMSGTMAHTDKRKLLKILEGTVSDHGSPSFAGTHIINGNFQLHYISPDQRATYGELS